MRVLLPPLYSFNLNFAVAAAAPPSDDNSDSDADDDAGPLRYGGISVGMGGLGVEGGGGRGGMRLCVFFFLLGSCFLPLLTFFCCSSIFLGFSTPPGARIPCPNNNDNVTSNSDDTRRAYRRTQTHQLN